MKLEKTQGGYALYKEKTIIGTCQARPTEQGADITALTIVPEWRRKGYGSYLLKEVLRSLGGYDKESATVFTAPLPADAGELAFWAKFGFAAEGSGLCRRRTPDLTAVKLVQDFLAARLADPRLCIDATCGNGGDTAFLCRLVGEGGRVLGFDIQPEAIASTRQNLARKGFAAELHCDSHANLLQYVQPGTVARCRPRGILPRPKQHPGAGSRPRGPAARRGAQRHPVQRQGHRFRRKDRDPPVDALPAPETVHRPCLRLCQLGRYRPLALLPPEKITKTLASRWNCW